MEELCIFLASLTTVLLLYEDPITWLTNNFDTANNNKTGRSMERFKHHDRKKEED